MLEFSLSWWQLAVLIFLNGLIPYLCGVVVGKQSMMSLILSKQTQMPQMPQMPAMPQGRG